MIKIARLSIAYAQQDFKLITMEDILNNAMKNCGVTRADIDLHGDDYSSKTHFGNWVLVPVLDNEASAKLADALGTKLDMQEAILEASDLPGFKVGDQVTVKFTSELCFPVDAEGRVISVSDKEIAIVKKGARSKSWRFRPGNRVTIEHKA